MLRPAVCLHKASRSLTLCHWALSSAARVLITGRLYRHAHTSCSVSQTAWLCIDLHRRYAQSHYYASHCNSKWTDSCCSSVELLSWRMMATGHVKEKIFQTAEGDTDTILSLYNQPNKYCFGYMPTLKQLSLFAVCDVMTLGGPKCQWVSDSLFGVRVSDMNGVAIF